VTFTTADGTVYSIHAGMILIIPPGGTPQPPIPLASVASTDPAVAALLGEAVSTFATLIRYNLGGLSADSMTMLASQIVGVASAAMPDQAANFTAQIVGAMASSPAYAGNPDALADAVASVTAAAAAAAPQQAAQIAGAAAAADPALAGVIAEAVSLTVPASTDAVMQAVAQATNQSADAVRQAAEAASDQVRRALHLTQPNVLKVIKPITAPTPLDANLVSPSS
jgi:ElaB/YqjD/DUF883 family membrane-anchored ribosome-binding protein